MPEENIKDLKITKLIPSKQTLKQNMLLETK